MNDSKIDRPIVIVHTESHKQWGGQERRVFTEGRWMKEKGHRLILLAPEGSPLFNHAQNDGWRTYNVSFNRWSMISDIWKVHNVLKRLQPDVLNTHGNLDSKIGLTAAMDLKIPCVIRSRHITPKITNNWYNRLLYQKLCHYIYTTSDHAALQINQELNVPRSKIFSIPSGIQLPKQLPECEYARKILAQELKLDLRSRFIGCVTRLDKGKGIADLIHAFEIIHRDLPKYHLLCVGEGGERRKLEKLTSQKKLTNRVHFLGYREEIWPIYRALDCNVLASREYEGVPQVLLEAMYAGCPVIGTKVGGIPEIVRHEETGLLVSPKDPKMLAQTILQVLRDINTVSRCKKAFEMVDQSYNVHSMGKRILGLYQLRLQAASF